MTSSPKSDPKEALEKAGYDVVQAGDHYYVTKDDQTVIVESLDHHPFHNPTETS